ncbi:dUTP pyrophosphatase [Leucobacter luti]|uniref:Deoxyuridine 5'-triphosphate nucleotidohydrolase n=1 Tax=Leucobacter luti TaxID=340320 RepID=A0A4R6RS17_9MICO|nr:dUTP pyrophosphatase [Leucobacter luti]
MTDAFHLLIFVYISLICVLIGSYMFFEIFLRYSAIRGPKSTPTCASKDDELHVVGVVPAAANPGDAGLDLRYDPDAEAVTLAPGEHQLLPTGTRIALPAGTVGLVCPRSGLAAKHGIGVVNGPGVVDSGYRGDVGVNLINHGDQPFTVEPGMRIAQLVITPFISPTIVEADSLDDTERGTAGFGSTGTA